MAEPQDVERARRTFMRLNADGRVGWPDAFEDDVMVEFAREFAAVRAEAERAGYERGSHAQLNVGQRLDEYRRGFERAREMAAKAAERTVGGFTANIRTSDQEQELIRDPDGPWVFNADVAAAIRALRPEAPDRG